MKSRIKEVGETDITVKQAFYKILEATLCPKYTSNKHINIQKHNFNRDTTVRDEIESMMSGINIVGDPNGMVKRAFQKVLEATLPSEYTTYKHIT